jgi:hypothetical protein
MTLPRIAIGAQAIAAAKREKQSPVPAVKVFEIHLDRRLDLLPCGKSLSHPVDRGCSRFTFSVAGRAFKQRGDFSQFFAKFSFSSHQDLPFVRIVADSQRTHLQFTALHGMP